MSDRNFLGILTFIAVIVFLVTVGYIHRENYVRECAIRRSYARTAFDSMTTELRCNR